MTVEVRDPVTEYARAAIAGDVVVGKPVRLACERHLRDLEEGEDRGLFFDAGAADRAIRFFRWLRLSEGEFAGEVFKLQPWQQFIVGSMFGWKGSDGFRRFRTAYIEVGKGNGKTPMAAGIGLLGLVADGEAGAEIYSAAVGREQARILFDDARHMVEASPELDARVVVMVNNLYFKKTESFFRPVSSEKKSLDGKRVHMVLVDELHEHPSDIVVNKMRLGTKGRRQPITFEITNAGFDRQSVCYQHHDYTLQVLEGVIEDDAWFGYVCSLDDGDDWRDEAVWVKANPNLGVSVQPRYLRELVTEAQGMPSKQSIVQRLNFCVWTEGVSRWVEDEHLDACAQPIDYEGLKGRHAYGGLDLASVEDIASFGLVFPIEDDPDFDYEVLLKYWVPADTVERRTRQQRAPYDVWVREGWITVTEGNVIDFDVIRAAILELAGIYNIRSIGFDRWGATQISTQLQNDGVEIVAIGQGMQSMSPPMKDLERLLRGHRIRLGIDPVLRWMLTNIAVESDAAGNIKPNKDKSRDKIDGVVSLVMALDRATRGDNGPSVYQERGVLSI